MHLNVTLGVNGLKQTFSLQLYKHELRTLYYILSIKYKILCKSYNFEMKFQ